MPLLNQGAAAVKSERRKGGEREEKAREQMNGHMSGDRGEIPDESWSPDWLEMQPAAWEQFPEVKTSC